MCVSQLLWYELGGLYVCETPAGKKTKSRICGLDGTSVKKKEKDGKRTDIMWKKEREKQTGRMSEQTAHRVSVNSSVWEDMALSLCLKSSDIHSSSAKNEQEKELDLCS